ncbi:TonB family protein [Cupriavidus sp. PET2-C1]
MRSAGEQPASPAAHPPGQLLDFDIPAQPLAAALNRYASLSGWPILFHGRMVAGRTSSAVQGRYRPEAALQRLLDGTGLAPEKVSGGPADAYVLKESDAQAIVARAAAPAVDLDYGGRIQAHIWQALCADARTVPGTYRSLLRFRVDTSGRVHAVRMFSSTGDGRRDAAVLETLRRVRMDRSPPPGMAQPLTMLVLPLDQAGGPRCVDARIDADATGAS